MEPHMWWEGGFRWIWIFPFTFMMLMMLLIGICVFGFFRRSGGWRISCPLCGWNTHGTKNLDTPRQILDRRYASGEITKEQYEGMKQDLER
ncbi:MAG: SHOCT domain-containing protein [Nitrospirota bacterium]|nr:SHOCT domain-containing protein [Nitrospirota bacterium]MDH5775148.1 SHOCT domain-containing protein [Nitrospirota bacterium]